MSEIKHRIAGIAALLLVTECISAIPVLAQNPDTPQQKLITISKETTRITEPLDEEGFVDYAAYLNRRNSEGVTLENNAAVWYWKAIAHYSNDFPAPIWQKVSDDLGVTISMETETIVPSFDLFLRSKAKPRSYLEQQILKQRERVLSGPWKSDDFPIMAEWIRLNETPLKLLVEGTTKSRCFMPVIKLQTGDSLLLSMTYQLEAMLHLRSAAQLLHMQAMQALGEGQFKESRSLLTALHRLARHLGNGVYEIDMASGNSIVTRANEGIWQTILHAGLSSKELTSWRKELSGLPPVMDYHRTIDRGERYAGLDVIQELARTTLPGESNQFDVRVGELENPVVSQLLKLDIEWDLVFRLVNEHYDWVLQTARLPTYRERKDAFDQLKKSVFRELRLLGMPKNLTKLVFGSADHRGRQCAKLAIAISLGINTAFADAGESSQAQRAALHTGLAIVAYRTDTGELPAKLSDLIPQYLDEIPGDPFTETVLNYKTLGREFAIYSFGRNMKDDGGFTHNDRNPRDNFDDIVFRSEGWIEKSSTK